MGTVGRSADDAYFTHGIIPELGSFHVITLLPVLKTLRSGGFRAEIGGGFGEFREILIGLAFLL